MTDVYQIALDTLTAGAPGLSDKTKEVLAGIIARKASMSSARVSEPEAVEAVGWMWRSREGTIKLTTWHPDTQAEAAERLYTHAALRNRTSEPEALEGEDKANHDCLAKRRPGEPMFILLGRDPDAHNIVQLWADRRLAAGGDPDHCRMGYDTAERMAAYAKDPANRPASAPNASEYPAPSESDDKLRVAVEALEPFAKLWDQISEDDRVRRAWQVRVRTTSDAVRKARQALAALNEQPQ